MFSLFSIALMLKHTRCVYYEPFGGSRVVSRDGAQWIYLDVMLQAYRF